MLRAVSAPSCAAWLLAVPVVPLMVPVMAMSVVPIVPVSSSVPVVGACSVPMSGGAMPTVTAVPADNIDAQVQPLVGVWV